MLSAYQQGKERVVYLMKDTKWIFYEKGERLAWEQSDMYAKRRIRDRLNEPMLLDYLLQVGLNARDSLFYHSEDKYFGVLLYLGKLDIKVKSRYGKNVIGVEICN